ncbi:MAG: hypothetical protein ACFE8B_08960 [Candidatus Hermodarchaeota archaeon]
MLVPVTTQKIQIVCPICKTRDLIGVPKRELNKCTHLTTISIHKGLICPHHFQVFVDKNLQIRGYQKVDFELNNENSKKLRNGVKAYNETEKEEKQVFNELENNLNGLNSKENKNSVKDIQTSVKKMTLKEIYEEFWEFIDGDNKTFQTFINNDRRRQKNLIDLNLDDLYNHQELN